jgi:hypothetical protein
MLSDNARLTLAGACATLVLAACSAGALPGTTAVSPPGGPASGAARNGWTLPMPKKKKLKLLYVTDYESSVVLIYQQGDTGAGPIGEISDGVNYPEDDAVDRSGNLYVANNGNDTVTIYAPGATSPSTTLSTDISDPLELSVDSKGILYVADGGASGKILEFKPGSMSPDATVSMPHPGGETNAKNDDLYVTHNQSSSGRVSVCKPLATSCTDLGISVGYAQGVALDKKGNLLVGDIYGTVIDIYKPGTTTPFRTITTKYESPSKLALNTTDSTLYMADPANFAVDIYNYKAGMQESSFTFGSGQELEGVALYPGQKPGP